jgi:hypothetical protein
MKKPVEIRFVCLSMSVLILLAAPGCRVDPVKGPAAGKLDLLPIADYQQIVVQSKLHDALRFAPPIVEPATQVKPMRVTVPVRSVDDRWGLNIQYRFEYLDEAKRPLATSNKERWVFKHLAPRVQAFLDSSAMDTTAADWRLIVRSGR